MKRNIILGVLLLSAVYVGSMFWGQVSAQKETQGESVSSPDANLLTEDFSYAAGQLTTVSSAAWVNFSGTGNFIPVSTGSLTYSGYAGSGIGNKIDIISVGTSAEDAYRQFAIQTTGTVYTAFLVNVANTTGMLDNTTTTGDYFAGFLPSASTTALVARVSIRQGATANTFNLGLRASSSNAATSFATTDLAVGTTHLVVISSEIVTGNSNDIYNMWINPALGGAQPAATLSQVSGLATDNADVARFFVRQGTTTTPNASIDGIIVGTAWADVAGGGGGATPTPTPTPAATPTPTPSPSPSASPTPTPAAPQFLFTTRMNGANERPNPNASTATGYGRVVLNAAETQITCSFYFEGLTTGSTGGHIHTGAITGTGPITFDMTPPSGVTRGSVVDKTFSVTPAQVATLRSGGMYFNVHSTTFTGGEIRGQLVGIAPDAPLDFNGDGKTDFGVVRQTTGAGNTQIRWYNQLNNAAATEVQTDFGVVTDYITPGDFDGDGKDDIAIWRPQTDNSFFYILQSTTNTLRTVRFGMPNDDPFLIADYDGDGVDDPAIFRKGGTDSSQSFFWWYGSFGTTKNVQVVVPWGVGVDVAAPGDYNGDGKADFCVFRGIGTPARGLFFIHYGTGLFDATSPNDTATRFGLPTDAVVPGDYDGDGKTDLALTRVEGAALAWYFIPSSNPTVTSRTGWGRAATDIEVQGDYDGDGKTDRAIWRSSTGNPSIYFILRSGDGVVQYAFWGLFGDQPAAQDSHL
ncbi:MAG: CHRD domain-containing protein [Pyrinomonadaceae bacterium]